MVKRLTAFPVVQREPCALKGALWLQLALTMGRLYCCTACLVTLLTGALSISHRSWVAGIHL